jgi:hypothetical protein
MDGAVGPTGPPACPSLPHRSPCLPVPPPRRTPAVRLGGWKDGPKFRSGVGPRQAGGMDGRREGHLPPPPPATRSPTLTPSDGR